MSVIRHGTIYLLARGLPSIINFLAVAIYTRLVAPEDYGHYALVIAGTNLALAIGFQWLRLGLLRFLPQFLALDRKHEFLSCLMVAFLALAGITGVGAGITMIFVDDPVIRQLLVFGVGVLWLQAWFELNLEVVRSQLMPRRYGQLFLSKTLISVTVGIGLAYLGFGAVGLLIGMMTGIGVPALWNMVTQWQGVRWGFLDRTIILQLLGYGLPLTATYALNAVIHSSDRLIVGWLLGVSATGLYAVGYDLAKQSIWVLIMSINLASYPLAVRALEAHGVAAAQDQLRQNVTLLLGIAVPAAAGLALLAPNIVRVLLGQEFREVATSLVPWIALATLLAGFKLFYLDQAFQLGKQTWRQIWTVLFPALLNVGLNLLWIPQWGLLGAAYATVMAYAMGLILSWRVGRRAFPMPFPLADFIKIIVATGGMSLALLPLLAFQGVLVLVLQVMIGVATYGVLSLLFDVAKARSKMRRLLRFV
jgi:O-antigen/teichoic acid export membrane protein